MKVIAAGIDGPEQLRPWHILRRTGQFEVRHYGEMFHYLNGGELLKEPLPKDYERAIRAAAPHTFDHVWPDETHGAPVRA